MADVMRGAYFSFFPLPSLLASHFLIYSSYTPSVAHTFCFASTLLTFPSLPFLILPHLTLILPVVILPPPSPYSLSPSPSISLTLPPPSSSPSLYLTPTPGPPLPRPPLPLSTRRHRSAGRT